MDKIRDLLLKAWDWVDGQNPIVILVIGFLLGAMIGDFATNLILKVLGILF
jgi:hypothetical protein